MVLLNSSTRRPFAVFSQQLLRCFFAVRFPLRAVHHAPRDKRRSRREIELNVLTRSTDFTRLCPRGSTYTWYWSGDHSFRYRCSLVAPHPLPAQTRADLDWQVYLSRRNRRGAFPLNRRCRSTCAMISCLRHTAAGLVPRQTFSAATDLW